MLYSNTNFNNKTILITGGAGFIGSNLAFYIQDNFPKSKIVIFDCFQNETILESGNLQSYGHYKNLINYTGDVICGNITNKNDLSLLNNYKFDYIFHHAAISDTRVYNQELVMKTNVNSFYDILKITKDHDATLVYASSAATYGNSISPQTIGAENPVNPYGYSKYMMDCIAENFSINNPNIQITGLRFFNVYGPKEFFKLKTSSMVIQFGHQILNGKAPSLFKDSNKILRDFIYIEDVVQANIKACKSRVNGYKNIYNVGTGISRSFQDIADILQNELGTDLGNNYIPNPYSGYQVDTRADIESTKKALEFNPNFSLEEGIKAYIIEIKRLHGNNYD
jgi:ADP-L-glycero-D-manno-heptose 6-epimerase